NFWQISEFFQNLLGGSLEDRHLRGFIDQFVASLIRDRHTLIVHFTLK
ncbi:MAG: hypothetical protein ACI9UN_001515, partial [Granulosicoccus sp.]